jgi:hypothetical protein
MNTSSFLIVMLIGLAVLSVARRLPAFSLKKPVAPGGANAQ